MEQSAGQCDLYSVSIYLPPACENISVPGLVSRHYRYHYHRSPLNDSPPPVDPEVILLLGKKGRDSPYSITERRVPELIPVLGSQPAVDVSHKPGGRLPLLSAKLAVPSEPLRGLLPISLLGEQGHDGCEQFA